MTESGDNVPIDSGPRWFRYAALITGLLVLVGFGIVVVGNLASLILIVLAWGAVAWLVLRKETGGPVEVAAVLDDGVHRVLVLANEGLSGEALEDHLDRGRDAARSEVLVVVPALASMSRRLAGAIDDELELAKSRAGEIAGALSADGRTASGRAGDSDPRLALEDALREFPAEEVVLVNPPEGQMGPLEASVQERATRDVPIPVRVLHLDSRPSG